MAEKVKSLGLSKSQGPTFSLRGSNPMEIYGGPTVRKQRRIGSTNENRQSGYLYYIKDGDLWRAKMKRR